ncbi:MAG: potassium transporter Trk, partial [Candidatus Cloacimonetes bacterium]|nr:potassium transporter Trk [Candidatus Cloacimonadota bacterium]
LKNVMINVMGGTTRINIFQLLKNIVIATAIIEACGAIILLTKFAQDFPIREAIYYSIFHSISAFCNAGFSPFESSMMMYSDSIIISLGMPLLIFLGGLGFTVILDLYRYFFKPQKVRKLSLHSKIVLTTTAILIIVGLIAFFILEYNNTMKGFSFKHRFLASLFQSVTPRTAGFNTIDNGLLNKGSVLMTLLLMFIGASPGSTGGGIKTTTLAVLALTIISMLKGRKDISVFKRRIPKDNFREASGLVFLAATVIFVIVMILMMVEPFSFEDIIFESISAFGTVGLSRGITPSLSSLGKILITLLMYIGRVGPLTLIYAFAKRRNHSNINYAEESIAIG